ncbi:hypothetical protein [Salininema proteolyticum]|uniref:DUF732 domain-containing protein n=1 Tax=Salininema proteolyticum TaxID=1607685 RepID=A0ABV8TVY4_9ACTN
MAVKNRLIWLASIVAAIVLGVGTWLALGGPTTGEAEEPTEEESLAAQYDDYITQVEGWLPDIVDWKPSEVVEAGMDICRQREAGASHKDLVGSVGMRFNTHESSAENVLGVVEAHCSELTR